MNSGIDGAHPLHELNTARESNEITAVGYAIGITRLWAEHFDVQQPVESGPSNAEMVENILASESDVRTAFSAGYDGHCAHLTPVSLEVRTAVGEVFGRQVLRNPSGFPTPGENARVQAVREAVSRFHGAEQPRSRIAGLPAETGLAYKIIGAHDIYKHMNKRIAGGYRQSTENEQFSVRPGFEEKFWRSRILGNKDTPGIIQTQGALARLIENIQGDAISLYGDEADGFLDAWWATVNMRRPDKNKTSYKDLMQPVLDALLAKNLDAARYQLKQYLFTKQALLPHRSQTRFALTEAEQQFFEDLHGGTLPEIGEISDERVARFKEVSKSIGSTATGETVDEPQ